jgi:hypothetical protein
VLLSWLSQNQPDYTDQAGDAPERERHWDADEREFWVFWLARIVPQAVCVILLSA